MMGFVCASSYADDPDNYLIEIQQAQDYMNNLKTAQARFVQTAPNGMQLVGTFYLNRPGRLRFEYDPPIEDFVVADGFFIYFYDSELEEQTNMPIGYSLADFVLRGDIDFSKDIIVSDVQNQQDMLHISLISKNDPDAGSLALSFSQKPFALKKWSVRDAMNSATEIELFYLKTGLDLDEGLFNYVDPNLGKGNNYNE